jgi:hypothetical protein
MLKTDLSLQGLSSRRNERIRVARLDGASGESALVVECSEERDALY